MGRWPRVRVGTLQPAVRDVPEATEESLRDFSHWRRRPPPRGRLDRSRQAPRRGCHCLQWPADGGEVGREVVSHLAPRSLVPEWPHPTRLETRTKECNMRASLWVANPSAQ